MRKIKIFEAFAGIGAQSAALKKANINYEVVGISEWFINALLAYDAIHHKTQTGKSYSNLIEFKDLIVNNELEHEIDIINELMLNDSINKNEMGVNLLTIII